MAKELEKKDFCHPTVKSNKIRETLNIMAGKQLLCVDYKICIYDNKKEFEDLIWECKLCQRIRKKYEKE